jgi:hypothetical protein
MSFLNWFNLFNSAPYFTILCNGQTICDNENTPFGVDSNAFDCNYDNLAFSVAVIRGSDGRGGYSDVGLFAKALNVSERNGVVNGTGGTNTMPLGYTEEQGDRITNNSDSIKAGTGHVDGASDTLFGGARNNTVFGNGGDDMLSGDAGNDLFLVARALKRFLAAVEMTTSRGERVAT